MRLTIRKEVVYWKTLFEKSSAGQYTVNIPRDGLCKILIIGGGGNGTSYRWYGGGAYQTEYAGGGAGAGITGKIQLTRGNYQLVIGDAGQDTTFLNQVAGRGYNGYTATSAKTKGVPGTATITLAGLTPIINDDATTTSYNTYWGWNSGDRIGYGGSSPKGIVRDGVGSGGTATYSDSTGKAGYARIDIVSTVNDYDYIETNDVTLSCKIEDNYYAMNQ